MGRHWHMWMVATLLPSFHRMSPQRLAQRRLVMMTLTQMHDDCDVLRVLVQTARRVLKGEFIIDVITACLS